MYPRIISDLIYRQYTYSETFNFNVVYGFRLLKSCFVHKYSQQWHNRCHWCSLSRVPQWCGACWRAGRCSGACSRCCTCSPSCCCRCASTTWASSASVSIFSSVLAIYFFTTVSDEDFDHDYVHSLRSPRFSVGVAPAAWSPV